MRSVRVCQWAFVAFAAAAASAADPPLRVAAPALEPLPERIEAAASAEVVELGRRLFFDVRLSGDNTLSCATCHDPAKGFADGLARSRGVGGGLLSRNTPTVLNVGGLEPLMWDGRAETLEEQALLPLQSHDEMRQDVEELVRELSADAECESRFRSAFGEGVSSERVAAALAAFQRTLTTPNSPLDRHLRGDGEALSAGARRGLELFRGDADCIRCHHGPLLTDGQFYRLGVGFTDRGRELTTGRREDRFKLRTPPLRNVALTAPYMHDGSQRTLFDVVEFYYRGAPGRAPDGTLLDVQPLRDRSYSEIGDLVEFLEALTGEPPQAAAPDADAADG
ncbi:MAG: cytochrome-c peroxidase [Planctomyces sp.]|nr:cytochrome-c peroxidase [Planctomyces sp.]